MTYTILTDDRKVIVRKLEELTGRKATYTGVPKCAYVLEAITVERDGTITTEADADTSLLNQLIQVGLIEERIQEERDGAAPEEIQPEEPEADHPPESCGERVKLNISYPLSKHSPESLCNLIFTIYSRGALLSKATGGKFSVSNELIEKLQKIRKYERIEQVLEIIQQAGAEELCGLAFDNEKVIFDGFPETSDPLLVKAWTELSAAINRNAIRQMRIFAKEVNDSNEKYAFRTWLTRLGMNGSGLKQERNVLYRNLSGHTAFRTEADREKWKKRQKEKRMKVTQNETDEE